jgi:hypothetical protein
MRLKFVRVRLLLGSLVVMMFIVRMRIRRGSLLVTFRTADLLDRFVFTIKIFNIILVRGLRRRHLGTFSRCILLLFLLILFVLFALALFSFLRLDHGLLLGQQGLAVGDRDAEIVGVNFGKRQKPVTVAAEINERRLQRRFNPRYLRKKYAAFKGFAELAFVIELDKFPAIDNCNPCFFIMGCIN